MSSPLSSKLDLSDPEKIQMATIVTKNSKTGFTSNKRLLAIRKGYLYYYSNVPKKFKGQSSILQTIHELPKCSIQIVNIKQIKGYESNSSNFSIQFQAKNMLQRQDIRKTMTLQQFNFSPKNSKQTIIWQFTCDNQFIKQKWVAALQGLHVHYHKQKKDIQKFFNDHNSQMKSSSSGGRNSSIPWRDSQSFNKKVGDSNYLQLITNVQKQSSFNDKNIIQNSEIIRNLQRNNSDSQIKNLRQIKNNQNANQNALNGKSNLLLNQQIYQNQTLSRSKSQITEKQSSPAKAFHSIILQPVNVNNSQSPINIMKGNNNSPSIQLNESKTTKVYIPEEGQLTKSSVNTKINQNMKISMSKQMHYDSSSDSDIQIEADIFQEQINQKQSLKYIKNSVIQISLQDKKQMKISKQNKAQFGQIKEQVKQIKIINNELQYKSKNINLSNESKRQLMFSQQNSYYSLQQCLFNQNFNFDQRLTIQKNFYQIIQNFKHRAINTFIQYVHQRIQSQQTNNLHKNYTKIYLKQHNLIMKTAYSTTQSLIINQESKLLYNEQNIKNLKREFKIYQQIFKSVILNQIKNQTKNVQNLLKNFKLRVPLCIFIEYKGIAALIFQNNQKYQNQINFKYIQHKNTYLNQIQILNNHNYDIKYFNFKQVTQQQTNNQSKYLLLYLDDNILLNRSTNQQSKKAYLKSLISINSNPKHHNIQFNPPLSENLIIQAKKSNASLSIQSLQGYVRTLKSIEHFKGDICSKQQIIQIFQIIIFCKQLRKIYRVAHGQIHQTDFLNLIFKNDQSMMKMLEESGISSFPQIKGILFTFIKYYLGIECFINQSVLEKLLSNKGKNKINQSLILSTEIHPIFKTYSLNSLELFQSSCVQKYFQQQKFKLAQKSLQILKLICNENRNLNQRYDMTYNKEKIENKFRILYHSALLMYFKQKDYLKSLQLCKQAENLFSIENHNDHSKKIKKQTKLFYLYLHMLKCYVYISAQSQFNLTVQKLFNLIEFNYGKQNCSLIIKICQIVAYYLVQLAEQKSRVNQKQQMINLALKYIERGMMLTLKLYGQQSNQFIDILIDISNVYKHKDQQKSLQYFNKVRILVIKLNNQQKMIQILIYQLKNNIRIKNYQKCQKIIICLNQMQLLYNRLNLNKFIQILQIQFQLGLLCYKYYLSRQSIDKLWLLNNYKCKKQCIKLIIKLFEYEQNKLQLNFRFKNNKNIYPYNNINKYSQQEEYYSYDYIIQLLEIKYLEDFNQNYYFDLKQNNKFKRIDLYDWIKDKIIQENLNIIEGNFQSNQWKKIFKCLQILNIHQY